MGEIICFERLSEQPLNTERKMQDHSASAQSQLLQRLRETREEIEKLDVCEPADMCSEMYETWADQHEELEDELDEILEELDVLE